MVDKNAENTEMVDETTGEVKTNTFEPLQYATFDVSDIKNRVRVFNAHNSAKSLKTIGDNPLNIVDVLAEPGKRARSGNLCQNTYLFTDDNLVFFTQSTGIARTVNELVEMVQGDFLKNTTSGYVTVQMVETKLSGDRTYKQFQLIAA